MFMVSSLLEQLILLMDNFGTGLVSAPRPTVKTEFDVYLAELEQQNLLITIAQFLGTVPKR